MPQTRNMDELILHTAGDVLYFGTGRPQAAVFDHGPQEFVKQEWVQQAESVRVLGTASNAPLIAELYNHRLKKGTPKIYLGSPSLCHLEREPPEVLRQLMEIEYPASVGGWHQMTTADFQTYNLVRAFMEADCSITDFVQRLFKVHPAYRALTFIPSLCEVSAIGLICTMLDPRFYVDPKQPDSPAKLKQRLGLGEPGGAYNAAAWMDGDDSKACNRFQAACLVFDTWSGGWEETLTQDTVGPRNFLLRVVKRVAAAKGKPTAILRASHVFVRFLRYTWLDSLTPARQYHNRKRRLGKDRKVDIVKSLKKCKTYSPTMFVPDHFFVNADEVEAWFAHMSADVPD